ncbi:MAG: response regulator, partial [Bacteroidota bacterium]|nr:response regulator [Bacteroidota bacterium]
LVVDDDPNILSAIGEFFRKEECYVITSSSTEGALELLKRNSIDLIITDVRLKGQSGVTFLLEVKRVYPSTPVIVMTGYPEVISESEVKRYGADFFFQKPLNLEKFRDAVRKCLYGKQSSNHTNSHN